MSGSYWHWKWYYKWYKGISPHLNSALQSSGTDWDLFHNVFMLKLDRMNLPENYYAITDVSLQNCGSDHNLPHEKKLSCVLIQYMVQYTDIKETVLRIELIHPLMKASETMRKSYQESRLQVELTGTRLLEIDLLDELPPLVKDIPDYSKHEPEAHPYSLTLIDHMDGTQQHHGFGVDEPIPDIRVPLRPFVNLLRDDWLKPMIGWLYRDAVESRIRFARLADITCEPERMETYSEADRAYIRGRMQHRPPEQRVK